MDSFLFSANVAPSMRLPYDAPYTSHRPYWTHVGDTETLSNSSVLEFVQSVFIGFSFEVQTKVRFELHKMGILGSVADELVGVTECYLSQLLALNGGYSTLCLQLPSENGDPTVKPCLLTKAIEIYAEESGLTLNTVNFDLELEVCNPRKSAQSHFITISRSTHCMTNGDPPQSVVVYRSPTTSLSPTLKFPAIQLSSERLCRGDSWRPIELHLYEASSPPRLVGTSQMTYFDIEKGCHDGACVYLQFLDGSPMASAYGALAVAGIDRRYSFLDYIAAGLEINVVVAIDFTRSNGDPRAAESLHGFVNGAVPSSSNEYVQVIQSVVEILEQYDSDKRFPVYGFGAKLPPSNTLTSHCFALNGDYFHPDVVGVKGILSAYRNALGTVTLHGPTRLADVLRVAGDWARPMQEEAKYLILLIITDGVIEDFQESADEIVKLAELPVSVLIVGVGNEDFSLMSKLDADEVALVSSKSNQQMSRDIVQFVPFRDFKDKPIQELATAALEEIPREVVSYFGAREIFPASAVVADYDSGPQESRLQYRGFTGTRAGGSPEEEEVGTPKFLDDKRTDLCITVHQQGYDEGIVERVVTETGVLCPDPVHVVDVMFHLRRIRGEADDQMSPPEDEDGQIAIADRLGIPDRLSAEAAAQASERKGKRNSQLGRRDSKANMCRVCFSHQIDIRIKNCNHLIICSQCFPKIQSQCPLCREPVSGFEPLAGA